MDNWKQASVMLLAAGALLTSGCGSGVSTNYDYDPTYDFSDLKTYSWMPMKVSVEIGELRAKRLGAAFDNELARMGMQAVDANPDFIINMHGSSQQKTDITDWGYGYGWRGGGGVDVTQYEEGTLIVDLVDGTTKDMIWRGTASAVVEPKATPEQQEQRFAQLARQILSQFPPKK